MSQNIAVEKIRLRIAMLLEQHLGLPKERLLADENFADVDEKFDSLAMIELQFILEDEFKIELPPIEPGAPVPMTISELSWLISNLLGKSVDKQNASGR